MASSQTFTNIDSYKWNRIRAVVEEKAGIEIKGNVGIASGKGITLSWSYNPDSDVLVITMVKRAFYDPSQDVIEADIAAMVEAA